MYGPATVVGRYWQVLQAARSGKSQSLALLLIGRVCPIWPYAFHPNIRRLRNYVCNNSKILREMNGFFLRHIAHP